MDQLDPIISVIICTHNPRRDYLFKTLSSIRAQKLPHDIPWELLVIDNSSKKPIKDYVDLTWHPRARIVREERLGLSYARMKSFEVSRGSIIIYVDDDNILKPDYLNVTIKAFVDDQKLGAVGGRAIPKYETEPPNWFRDLGLSLACRDLGDVRLSAEWSQSDTSHRQYPSCAPIGAGMGVRRQAYAAYVEQAKKGMARIALGRRGVDLASGEDNDIVMTMLENGWRVSYFPELCLEHLIPGHRLTPSYLARYAHSTNRTWVMVLDLHDIRPWPAIATWTLPWRKAKAFFAARAWSSMPNYIRWRGMCGLLEGQSALAD